MKKIDLSPIAWAVLAICVCYGCQRDRDRKHEIEVIKLEKANDV